MTQIGFLKKENTKVLIPLGSLVAGLLIAHNTKEKIQRAIGITLAGVGVINLLSSFVSAKIIDFPWSTKFCF